MKIIKKRMSILMCVVMMLGLLILPSNVEAAGVKTKISAKKITLKVGQKKTLTVKKGSKKVKGVKWKTSNKKVATVKSGKVTAKKVGKAKITATVKKKKYTCTVTVKKKSSSKNNTVAPTTEKPTTEKPTTEKPTTEKPTTEKPTTEKPTTEKPTTEKPTTEEPTTEKPTTEEPTTEEPTTEEPSNSFSFKNDVTIEYGTKDVYVEFEIKDSAENEVEELEKLGFKIDEGTGTASKVQVCETAKYTFNKMPSTVEDIQSFFDEAEPENYGGFNAMAATICAACTFKGGSNPSDPFFSKDPVREMFEYINGPAESMNIAKAQMDNAIVSMKSAIQSCGENVYKSYFNGANNKNNYTPDEPYVLEMYRGPYYIESKETITGTRPTTYMILVKSGGADIEKYIDVYYSTKMGRWFSYENQFMHVIANDFKPLEEEL